jgi:hypothetical protein
VYLGLILLELGSCDGGIFLDFLGMLQQWSFLGDFERSVLYGTVSMLKRRSFRDNFARKFALLVFSLGDFY